MTTRNEPQKTATNAAYGAANQAYGAANHADDDPRVNAEGDSDIPAARLIVGHITGEDVTCVVIGVPAFDGQNVWVRLTLGQARQLSRQLTDLVDALGPAPRP